MTKTLYMCSLFSLSMQNLQTKLSQGRVHQKTQCAKIVQSHQKVMTVSSSICTVAWGHPHQSLPFPRTPGPADFVSPTDPRDQQHHPAGLNHSQCSSNQVGCNDGEISLYESLQFSHTLLLTNILSG